MPRAGAALVRENASPCKNNKSIKKPSIPKMPPGSYKPSKAKQLAAVFGKLKHLLLTEWPSIRCMNLGVKSGTGIVEDVLLVQLQQLAVQVHTLAVCDAEAAAALVDLVDKMSEQHFQQLQVLFDVLGHEELSDYLRLLVGQLGSRSSSRARRAAAAAGLGSCTASAASQLRGASSLSSQAGLDPYSTGSSWQGRARAAGGVFDLDGFGSSSSAGNSRHQSLGYNSLPDMKGLKFATLLPAGHILTKTAEDLQRHYEFQAALQASAAAAAAAKAAAAAARQQQQQRQRQQPVVPLLHLSPPRQYMHHDDMTDHMRIAAYQGMLPDTLAAAVAGACRPGSGGSCNNCSYKAGQRPGSPFLWGTEEDQGLGFCVRADQGLGGSAEPPQLCFFRAPSKGIEQIWKEGRKATTEAVLSRAHMQVHESPLDVLMLAPAVPVQPRVLQLPVQPVAVAAAAAAAPGAKQQGSRRASASSRPGSACNTSRRASRMSSCGVGDAGTAAAGALAAATGCGVLRESAAATGCGVLRDSAAAAAASDTGRVGMRVQQQQQQQQPGQPVRARAGFVGSAGGPLLPSSSEAGSPCSSNNAGTGMGERLGIRGASSSSSSVAPGSRHGLLQPASLDHEAGGSCSWDSSRNSWQQSAAAGQAELLMMSSSNGSPTSSSSNAGAGVARKVAVTGSRMASGIDATAGASSSVGAAVPALQLSRLGSMHAAPGMQQRPGSAASSSRSRPGSAASTSRLAVSARVGVEL